MLELGVALPEARRRTAAGAGRSDGGHHGGRGGAAVHRRRGLAGRLVARWRLWLRAHVGRGGRAGGRDVVLEAGLMLLRLRRGSGLRGGR